MQLCNVCINSHPSHSRSTLNKQDNTQIHFHIDVLRIHISNDWMLFLFSKSITRKFNYIWDSSRLITVKYRRSETTSIDCQRFLVARSRFSNCNSFSFRIKGVNRRVVIPILYYCVHLHLIHLNRHKKKTLKDGNKEAHTGGSCIKTKSIHENRQNYRLFYYNTMNGKETNAPTDRALWRLA